MYGRGRHRAYWTQAAHGYTYMGPCRCGHGPHAFYRDPGGRFANAHGVPWWTTSATLADVDLKAELNQLKEEKSYLEKRIESLETQLKEK